MFRGEEELNWAPMPLLDERGLNRLAAPR
jgi:hypothetical protein